MTVTWPENGATTSLYQAPKSGSWPAKSSYCRQGGNTRAEVMTSWVKAIRTAIRKGQKEGRECGGGKRPFWEEGSGEASCGERGS